MMQAVISCWVIIVHLMRLPALPALKLKSFSGYFNKPALQSRLMNSRSSLNCLNVTALSRARSTTGFGNEGRTSPHGTGIGSKFVAKADDGYLSGEHSYRETK
eukprot:gnl/TRDRNA2_/TRDRNA2_140440_c0_seq1.p1 gnl/TRDRNA2_/TRDRNA2_140440_c0~~gnl/TRDRNA2_/TRDRNA2_140440_c0_seq1.p1  ORF type:complete len:103 (-),score=9.08 gnl/TRDRNA2_/TRDRNA2_140440_c0_seq1:23-331(-)